MANDVYVFAFCHEFTASTTLIWDGPSWVRKRTPFCPGFALYFSQRYVCVIAHLQERSLEPSSAE